MIFNQYGLIYLYYVDDNLLYVINFLNTYLLEVEPLDEEWYISLNAAIHLLKKSGLYFFFNNKISLKIIYLLFF